MKNKNYNRDLQNFIIKHLTRFVDMDVLYTDGVYMIEDFYIGRTKNIKNRIASHIIEAMEGSGNKVKNLMINKILNSNNKIKVSMLSDNQEDEESLIVEYSSKFNLVNIEFNPKIFTMTDLLIEEANNNTPIERVELYDAISKMNKLSHIEKYITENRDLYKTERDCGWILFTAGNKFATVEYINWKGIQGRPGRLGKVFGSKNVLFKFIPQDVKELEGYELITMHLEDREKKANTRKIEVKGIIEEYLSNVTEGKITDKMIRDSTGITQYELSIYRKDILL